MEKTSNLTVLEKGVNKKVLAFTDDPKVFRVLKMKADGKKKCRRPQNTERSGYKTAGEPKPYLYIDREEEIPVTLKTPSRVKKPMNAVFPERNKKPNRIHMLVLY